MIIKDISHIITDLLTSPIDHATIRLEQMQVKIMNRTMLLLTAVLLLIGGLGMIVYSIHTLLAEIIHPVASGLILGLTLILTALILIFITGSKSKD